MIWIHEPSVDSEQNLERRVVVRIDNAFILKDENRVTEFDIVDIEHWEYMEWVSEGNIPEIWSPDGN